MLPCLVVSSSHPVLVCELLRKGIPEARLTSCIHDLNPGRLVTVIVVIAALIATRIGSLDSRYSWPARLPRMSCDLPLGRSALGQLSSGHEEDWCLPASVLARQMSAIYTAPPFCSNPDSPARQTRPIPPASYVRRSRHRHTTLRRLRSNLDRSIQLPPCASLPSPR